MYPVDFITSLALFPWTSVTVTLHCLNIFLQHKEVECKYSWRGWPTVLFHDCSETVVLFLPTANVSSLFLWTVQ